MDSSYYLLLFPLLLSASRAEFPFAVNETMRYSAAKDCASAGDDIEVICHDDRTIYVCYEGIPIWEAICEKTEPYCYMGECQRDPPPPPPPEFKCPITDGYVPNPSNCSEFYICVHGVANRERCDREAVYDPSLKSCALQSPTRPCHEVDCSKTDKGLVVYPGDKSFYGICFSRRLIGLGKCEEPDHEMVPEKQECHIACQREGNMPDHHGCNSYYECVAKPDGSFTANKKTCPPGSFFSYWELHCVTGDCPTPLPPH